MRIRSDVIAARAAELAAQKSSTGSAKSWIVICVLCVTNFLALYNDAFRSLLGASTRAAVKVAEESGNASAKELSQIALLLGVSATDAAANVKYLLDKSHRSDADSAILQQKLGAAEKSHQDLVVKHRSLEAQHVRLEKSRAETEARAKEATRKLSTSVTARTTRRVARHVGGAAGESIPVVGTAVVAAMLALDVVDACDLIKELNEMNRSVGIEVEDEQRVCGVKVPDQKQLAAEVSKNWQAAYQSAASAVGKPPTVPQVSWNDLKVQVCAVTAVPMVCP